ncbi:MAG: hypothetical protein ABI880_14995 [Acidobacteriota bacterium]
MISAHVLLLALLQSASNTTTPPVAPPALQAVPADPSRLLFPAGSSGLVLVLVKPDRTADYEAVIAALTRVMGTAPPEVRARAGGWKVFKAQEPDAKGNAVYVHFLATPDAAVDYRPSVVLERLMGTLPEAELVKYRDALAAPPTRLSLALLADLSLAPVAKR